MLGSVEFKLSVLPFLAELYAQSFHLKNCSSSRDHFSIIERYKSLADIERGFKVLKSELEIGPVYHRLPERIRAHASICFMALVLHRVMRMRLRAGQTGLTPERALQSLKRIQHHRVSINGAQPLSGVSSISAQDSQVFKALKVKPPSQTQQMSLL